MDEEEKIEKEEGGRMKAFKCDRCQVVMVGKESQRFYQTTEERANLKVILVTVELPEGTDLCRKCVEELIVQSFLLLH